MSYRPLKVVVALDDGIDSETVRQALPGPGELELLEVAVGLEDGRAALAANSDAAVVGCDGATADAVELVAEAVARRPERPVIVICVHAPNGLMERLFEAGADDLVVLPERADRIGFALEKAVARRHGAVGSPGRLLVVLGPKGGTGKTVVSTNVAVALATRGVRTALVDIDLQFGDVALSLGLDPRPNLYDLARSGGTLDTEKVRGYLLDHPSGLRVLAAPLRPDEAGAVGLELLGQVYASLRELAEVVFVDTGPGFPREVIAAVDEASDLCLVGTLDASSLKDSKLGLETLTRMGYDAGACRLVLNRAGSRVGISERDAERILGRAPDVLVPSDRAVPLSVNEGQPVVSSSPRSGAGRALAQLAELYFEAPAPAVPARRSRHLIGGRA